MVIIPIAWDFWQSKKSLKTGTFRTKTKIMRELVAQIADNIPFSYILLYGLYQSEAMMDYLDALKINFLMRLPRNRTVRCSEGAPAFKVGDHCAYRLRGNQRSIASIGFLNGKMRYIAAEKRKDATGSYQTVFLISNFEKEAKEYLSIYMLRWDIEQFFRTSKQSLGLGDCQAIYLKRQRLHMFSVFTAFAIADSIKYLNNLPCTGDGIRYLKNFISDVLPTTEGPTHQVSCAIA